MPKVFLCQKYFWGKRFVRVIWRGHPCAQLHQAPERSAPGLFCAVARIKRTSSVGWVRHAPKNASPSAGAKPDETLTHIDVRRSLVTSEFDCQPYVLFLSGSTPYSPAASLTCGWERKRGGVDMKLSPSGESAMERGHSDALHEQKEMGWNDPATLRIARHLIRPPFGRPPSPQGEGFAALLAPPDAASQ